MIKLPKNKDLHIRNFYMPQRNLNDINELDTSLKQLFNTPISKNTLVVGDFNCQDIDWTNQHVNVLAPTCPPNPTGTTRHNRPIPYSGT